MFEHTHTQKQARIFTPQWGFAVRGGLSGRVQIVMFEHIHEETETQLPPKGGGGGRLSPDGSSSGPSWGSIHTTTWSAGT